MNGNGGIETFVRSRLETGVSREAPRLEEIVRFAAEESFVHAAERRSRRRLLAASLVAASLAAVCSFQVLRSAFAPDPESTVACVIDLLRVADGVEPEEDESSVAEMLLAWQDAPYESAIGDIASAN